MHKRIKSNKRQRKSYKLRQRKSYKLRQKNEQQKKTEQAKPPNFQIVKKKRYLVFTQPDKGELAIKKYLGKFSDIVSQQKQNFICNL